MNKRPRVVAIIQARMDSTRLPGKTMMDLCGTPLIGRLISQLSNSRTLDSIVIATSNKAADNVIVKYCENIGVDVVCGSQDDVLSRYLLAAERTNTEIVVRLTGDCPLHSSDTVDEVVEAFFNTDAVDYASNTSPYTRPEGQDVEVFTIDILRQANLSADHGPDREHVTPWIRRNVIDNKLDFYHKGPSYSSSRWSVDHQDDFEFVQSVWSCLDGYGSGPFNFEEIMKAVIESKATQGKSIINEGFYTSIYDQVTSEPASPLTLDKSFEWLERSDKVIPGGAQTYSKSWRHHIRGVTPIFLEKGKGALVTDVDGNQYVDLIQGLLPNILGYGHEEVNKAALERANEGHSFSLAHPLEVKLAERLCSIIPCAEMIRFGKNGSDATAGAVRVARAFTKREHVAVCGYHGWQDWFIGTTSRKAGVPKGVQDLAHPFSYNDLDSLDELLSSKQDKFAAVIMEPVNFYWPDEGYLEKVKEITHKHGALLIFDEICSGFHFGLGGAQKLFDVVPDLATFGKAMGNGWPISCIGGRREIMQVFDDAFVSFTFAGDVSAMAASIKVLDILETSDAYARMSSAGTKLFDGAMVMAREANLQNNFVLKGHPHWPIFSFVDDNGEDDPITRAFWIQELTRRGVLILTTFNISSALDEKCTTQVLEAFAHAFKRIAHAKSLGVDLGSWLDGPPCTPAFKVR